MRIKYNPASLALQTFSQCLYILICFETLVAQSHDIAVPRATSHMANIKLYEIDQKLILVSPQRIVKAHFL